MNEHGTVFVDALLASLGEIGVELEVDALAMMEAHFGEVLRGNSLMNLTRIVEPAAAAVQHYADSLALLAWMAREDNPARTMLDVGSGAGFPAFPMAIAYPELAVTVLEARKKKAAFLCEAAAALGIGNLRVVHAHSEHWRGEARSDLVTFRAVGALEKCLTLGAPHVGENGTIVAYKTARMTELERRDGVSAGKSLRLRPLASFPYELKVGDEPFERQLLLFCPGGRR